MYKPCCIVSKHCVRALNRPWRSRIGTHKWRRHTSHCDVMNRYHQSDVFLFNHDYVISILNFPVNGLCHYSIGNKLFGFVFSRSDEPTVVGVCGMRSADQDHRIVSEPIASGSFLESGPGDYHIIYVGLYLNLWWEWANPTERPKSKLNMFIKWQTQCDPIMIRPIFFTKIIITVNLIVRKMFFASWRYEKCCARSKHQRQRQVITYHSIFGL